MKKPMTREDREYIDEAMGLGCIPCLIRGYRTPADHWNHARHGVGMGQRSAHQDGWPTCRWHHLDGPMGEAYHAGTRAFRAKYGSDADLIALTRKLVEERRGTECAWGNSEEDV